MGVKGEWDPPPARGCLGSREGPAGPEGCQGGDT